MEWSLFAKESSGLAVRTSLNPEPLAENLTSLGEGRTVGAQAVVRVRDYKTVTGWLSYTISRSERRDGPEAPVRPFDYDQPHALTLVVSTTPIEGWNFGFRLRASSGYPRVRVSGAYLDARTGAYEPLRQGRERLPPFVQLDIHCEKVWKIGPARAALYLDILNSLNRQNPEEAVYRYDYRERRFLTGFPFVAVLGARADL
jgi:hypothetical protein